LCDSGYGGSSCSLLRFCSIGDLNACSGHGTCEVRNGNSSMCACDPGWTGTLCSSRTSIQINSISTCPFNCSGHGSCLLQGPAGNNTCSCDLGWLGQDCAIWAGLVATSASCVSSSYPVECTGRGKCNGAGACVCDAGYSGIDCEVVEVPVCNRNVSGTAP
jgi:hypothetical protein